jgi:hypothetical protein
MGDDPFSHIRGRKRLDTGEFSALDVLALQSIAADPSMTIRPSLPGMNRSMMVCADFAS